MLESRRPTPNAKPKPCNTDPVEVKVQFFDLWQQRIADPEFLNPHRKKQQQAGLYTSENDRQQLIRVLYFRNIYQQEPDFPAAPDVEHIDILEFGVLSNHIVDFFTSILEMGPEEIGIDKGNGRFLRFSKPFKPIIQQREKLHSHLRKLELDCGIRADAYSTVQSATPAPEARRRIQRLWMLFEAGDDIYCPSRQPELSDLATDNNKTSELFRAAGREFDTPIARYTPQAYHVTAAIGGSVRRDSWANWSNSELISMIGNENHSSLMKYSSDSLPSQRRNPGPNTPKFNVGPMAPLAVRCYYLDFNGREYGSVHDIFIFRPYTGEIDICSLEAYPLTPTQKSELKTRGLGFTESTSVSHMQCQGYTVGLHQEEIDTRVIVDMRMAFIETPQEWAKAALQVPKFISATETDNILTSITNHPSERKTVGATDCGFKWCRLHVHTHSTTRWTRMTWLTFDGMIRILLNDHGRHGSAAKAQRSFVAKHLKPRLLHLLPGKVPRFALRNRKWALLELTRLQPVEYNYGWRDLVLPAGHRKMVQAMVETHATQQADRHQALEMDSVPGKGKGCIILLHGVPGVGKTSTAECVAAHTKKPLYPITCADIGYQPNDIERNMEHHFRLAHKWDCVLLLDEADVFLAKRDQRDMERNGLVSVFLRILEYYSGILFLTTNRVGAIDDAFRSRLHLTLYYPRLGRDQTITIFKRNFERVGEINKDREKHNLAPFEYKDQQQKILVCAKMQWKTLRWNGRQIRNAFQTVMALAEFKVKRRQASEGDQKNPVLTKRHFEIVANATLEFNQYLKETQGVDQEKKAKRDQIRDDDFEGNSEKKHYEATSEESDTDDSEELEDQTETVTEDEGEEENSDAECKKKGKTKGGKQGKTAKNGKETKDKKKEAKKGGSEKKKKGRKPGSDDEDDETEDDD